MNSGALILDANILIRAVLGRRVRDLIYNGTRPISFFSPAIAFDDAGRYLPSLLRRRGLDGSTVPGALARLQTLIRPIQADGYAHLQQAALERIAIRDADDWHVLACAMALDCPVWTEDRDFFGMGVATWTTDRIFIYLRATTN